MTVQQQCTDRLTLLGNDNTLVRLQKDDNVICYIQTTAYTQVYAYNVFFDC